MMARRSGPTEAEGSPTLGMRGKAASSPDKAGAGQHCQMIWRLASETGRCNDSESVRYILRCKALPPRLQNHLHHRRGHRMRM